MTIAPEYLAPPAQAHQKALVILQSAAGTIRLRTNDQGYGYRLQPGAEGLGLADVENVMEELTRGSIHQLSRLTAGETFLPIMSRTTSNTALKDMRRELARVLRPAAGTVDVVIVDPVTGDERRRSAYYRTGLGAPAWRSPRSELHGVVLDYADPLWRGASRRAAWTLSTVIKPYWSSFPRLPHYPARLSSSTILGRREFTISGDADTHPVWEFRGTGEDLLIQCNHCGDRIFIEGEVPDGLRIDTHPHIDDITAPGWDPADLWNKVSDDTSLFHLQPGSQEVTMSVVGATGATEVILTYAEQWMAGY